MPKKSAGLLLYKLSNAEAEVFLVHPGGPFWAKKDKGAWSIPKGGAEPDEDPFAAALREFQEETGQAIAGDFRPLPECRQSSGKIVQAWAVEGEIDAGAVTSNAFEMEWPPRSGQMQSFPEVDRGAWFTLSEARERINPGQVPLLDALKNLLGLSRSSP